MIGSHSPLQKAHKLLFLFKILRKAAIQVSSRLAMMKVHVIPMLQDNFSYLIVNKKNESVAIDPVEPEKLFSKLREENLQLKGVLITHHHEDHAGGNEKLLKTMEVPVWGGDERIPALSQRVKGDGDSISVLDGIEITALKTPCHTKGSISYLVKDIESEASKAAVFTGDTYVVY